MIEFRLPSLGAEMDEGTLLEWKVTPGQLVKKGDVVAVVDTSKAAIDVEIWEEGIVHELVLDVRQKVPVGTVMLRLLAPGEAPPAAAAPKPAPSAPVPAPAARAPVAPVASPPSPAPPGAVDLGRRRVSPVARRRAEALGVDLARVNGSGEQGAVTLEDVERAATGMPIQSATGPARGAPSAAPGPAPRAADRAGEMRAAIAAAMARSKREIPHYYLATDIPLARLAAWLAARNAQRPVTQRLLLAVPMLKAVALALRRYPELNGFHRDGAFVPGAGIHVGVAISLRQGGLIAPAIRDADTLGLDELMGRLTDLVARARALSLRSSEISEATVTVTQLGDRGVDLVHGVIYPPQVALVGFGRPRDRPWVEDGHVQVRPVVTASLAGDHRASDGHRGGLFLAEVARLLQDPRSLDPSPAC